MKIAGLIAAAGDSTRMGFPKALLRLDGKTFVERLATIFLAARLDPVIVTLPIGIEFPTADSVMSTLNRYPEIGYMGSIRTAIDLIDADAFIVCPVDCPFVSADIVRAIKSRLAHGATIVVPTHLGKRGHPIGISHSTFAQLGNDGLQRFLDNRSDVIEIECDDNRILANINSPSELRESHLSATALQPLSMSPSQIHTSLAPK